MSRKGNSWDSAVAESTIGTIKTGLFGDRVAGSIDFTILKVRDNPEREDGTGWYKHPKGTVAGAASAEELAADGIDPSAAGT